MATRMKQLGAMTLVALLAGSYLLIYIRKGRRRIRRGYLQERKCAGCHGDGWKGQGSPEDPGSRVPGRSENE